MRRTHGMEISQIPRVVCCIRWTRGAVVSKAPGIICDSHGLAQHHGRPHGSSLYGISMKIQNPWDGILLLDHTISLKAFKMQSYSFKRI